MPKSKLDDAEVYRLHQTGASKRAIAANFGVDEASIRRAINRERERLGETTYLLPTEDRDRFLVELEQAPWLTGATAIGSDFHVPLFDEHFINRAIDHWRDAGCKQLLIAGDYWNEDSLSAFEYKQQSANLSREQREGNNLMKALLESFETITMIYGNHDARLLKLLGYKISFAEAMGMMFYQLSDDERSRLQISGRDHAFVEAGYEFYRVCHPKDYSAIPCSNARRLAAKYQEHVLCGHSHHTAISSSACGNYIAAEIGGFYDVDKTDYVQRTTSHARWQKGYGFIEEDGHFVLEAELWSSRR